jgi:anti-anti-sigma factor
MEPKKYGNLLVYSLEGDLPVTQLLEFKQKIADAVGKRQAVALDLSKVRSLNSNAIGLFINANQKLKAAGTGLYIVAPTPDVYEVMTLVSLEDHVPIYQEWAAFQKEVVAQYQKGK